MPSTDPSALCGVLVLFHGVKQAADPGLFAEQQQLAELYVEMPGLLEKAFVCDPATDSVGAFYLWETESQARDLFTSEKWDQILAEFGTKPTFQYFNVGAVARPTGVVAPNAVSPA